MGVALDVDEAVTDDADAGVSVAGDGDDDGAGATAEAADGGDGACAEATTSKTAINVVRMSCMLNVIVFGKDIS